MVWCMMNGIIYNTCAADESESEWMWELKKVSRDIKIVEDEFDEHGRPKVKIVYLDARDWSSESLLKNKDVSRCLMRCEKKMIAKLNNDNQTHELGETHEEVQPPRMIFVTQDRDYWPGSENDPEAMRRRALKEKAFAETGRGVYFKRPGYMQFYVPPNLDDDYSSICDDCDSFDLHFCTQYLDPSLPGTKFIRDNFDETDLKWRFGSLEERNSRIYKDKASTAQITINSITEIIKLRLLSCSFKECRSTRALVATWHLPSSSIRPARKPPDHRIEN